MESLTITKKDTLFFNGIDRQSVREFVAEYAKKISIASYCGDNVHQLALDQQDRVDQMTSSWSDEDKILFFQLYSEELDAHNKAEADKINLNSAQAVRKQIQTAQDAGNVARWISIIAFFIVLISFIKLIK